ncbi:hypothetical protein J6590_063850 [Homalodisca vitripennis]|nr:hypothetical protein J6590_101008 [Homalodisca vitripennis]KAG8305690.1 hypothetical protein J6590_063850 [Homalodisca vitripennis]
MDHSHTHPKKCVRYFPLLRFDLQDTGRICLSIFSSIPPKLALCSVDCVEMDKKLQVLNPNKGTGRDSIPPKISCTYQRNHSELLERVKHRYIKAVGVVLGFGYVDIAVAALKRCLGLLRLEFRRRQLDLMFIFKLLYARVNFPVLLSIVGSRVSRHMGYQEPFGKYLYFTFYRYHVLGC